MALYSTIGIVLKVIKYKESSIICDIYTESKGLRSFIISGVRSKKSRSGSSIFQHMNIVNITAYETEGDKLARIKEYSMSHIYERIPFNVLRYSVGTFTVELAKNAIKEREQNAKLFEFLLAWYMYVDGEEPCLPLCHIKYMISLSYLLGFGPLIGDNAVDSFFDLVSGQFVYEAKNNYTLNADGSKYLMSLIATPLVKLDSLSIPKSIRKYLIESLLSYYKLHLPDFQDLKSYAVLEELMS